MNGLCISPGVVRPSPRRALALVVGGCLAVLARPVAAGSHAGLTPAPIGDRVSTSVCTARRLGALQPVGDVALRSGGVLDGRILYGHGPVEAPGAGLSVALWHGGRIVARSTTDVRGRFAFRAVRGGLYRVVVDTGEGRFWRSYRLWTAEGAPPDAQRRVHVVVGRIDAVGGRRLLRGQSPIPGGHFPREAVVAAIAAGAIAPPIIHQGAKQNDHIPASP